MTVLMGGVKQNVYSASYWLEEITMGLMNERQLVIDGLILSVRVGRALQ